MNISYLGFFGSYLLFLPVQIQPTLPDPRGAQVNTTTPLLGASGLGETVVVPEVFKHTVFDMEVFP